MLGIIQSFWDTVENKREETHVSLHTVENTVDKQVNKIIADRDKSYGENKAVL